MDPRRAALGRPAEPAALAGASGKTKLLPSPVIKRPPRRRRRLPCPTARGGCPPSRTEFVAEGGALEEGTLEPGDGGFLGGGSRGLPGVDNSCSSRARPCNRGTPQSQHKPRTPIALPRGKVKRRLPSDAGAVPGEPLPNVPASGR